MLPFTLLTIIVILLAWITVYPQLARECIAELKRRIRLWIIKHNGEKATQVAAQKLYQKAVQVGHDPEIVEQVLEENWDIIRDRLGRPIADEILGEPSPLERYG